MNSSAKLALSDSRNTCSLSFQFTLAYLPQTPLPQSGSSTSNTSPTEPTAGTSMKSVFAGTNILGPNSSAPGGTRLGAGSPLHDPAARLFPKRTRELQARGDGLSSNIWGPPTSGNSTPLRETI